MKTDSRKSYIIEVTAAACHEANRAYCLALGDDSHQPWSSAPEWQRESARLGVKNIIDNPDCTPTQSHESWLNEKRAQGWVYGPVKNMETKTHPCCMPYSELSPEQRRKDDIFLSTARTILAILNVSTENSYLPSAI